MTVAVTDTLKGLVDFQMDWKILQNTAIPKAEVTEFAEHPQTQ